MRHPFAAVRTLAAAFAVAASATPALAQRVLIDFHEFRSDTTVAYQATPGGDVASRGFEFWNNNSQPNYSGDPRNELQTWGTNAALDPVGAANVPTNLGPTAAALYLTGFYQRVDMVRSDDRLFNLYSIDVAHEYNRSYLLSGNLSPISLVFYGFDSTGANTVATSFSIPAPPIVGGVQAPLLYTLNFSSAWRFLSDVVWFQQSGPYANGSAGSAVSHQFTNISAEVVPEPGTTALVVMGLGGVLVLRRRRRADA